VYEETKQCSEYTAKTHYITMTIHFTDKKTNTKSFDKSNAVIYTYTL